MPAEWETHERTWMAWPSNGYTLGETEEDANRARQTWANVANAIIRFEPVTMAKEYLDNRVDLVTMDLNDAWMRDIGPTYVKDNGELVAVNWVFNGWGAQSWASWNFDDKVASAIADVFVTRRVDSPMINEGGGIHVNGQGTILLTETVQLGDGRNSDWTKEQVEAEFQKLLGTNKAVWIKRGLTRDYDEFGTRGHIDIVACFSDENTILYHDQQNPEHPDFEVSQEVRRTLEQETNFRLIPVPAPTVLHDGEGPVDYSYINHYICNGAVILCAFDDPNDEIAKGILEQAYPNREIVLVDARELFSRGGGIHCITQQKPE
jgi:agmatine deiminase